MPSFPRAPRLFKGAIVLLDSVSFFPKGMVTLQYNPETLRRTLQVQRTGSDGGDHLEALRLTAPPIETIQLEAEIDATDQLEFPVKNPVTVVNGIHPQLAALETIIYPKSREIQQNNVLARSGNLEIVPIEADLSVFVWSVNRVLPVRLTEFSITEEAFDTLLNPIRAKVSLGMQVLSTNDLRFDHKGSSLFSVHHKQKEVFANMNLGLNALGAIASLL
ncbi:hypothetical protein F7734_08925 [Scytonema sp. UIC 10036]|uniref:hypothetical protein n=1 Tax=Scytonema sp. UIC 10036 TaxID=2304196 RepID=UPI0012DA0E34|nr:hypothetical protein [Scytonema sp. UIC 10036]MUG92574.1 hypothetical protein [Scytonema sp. UIC 10036]